MYASDILAEEAVLELRQPNTTITHQTGSTEAGTGQTYSWQLGLHQRQLLFCCSTEAGTGQTYSLQLGLRQRQLLFVAGAAALHICAHLGEVQVVDVPVWATAHQATTLH